MDADTDIRCRLGRDDPAALALIWDRWGDGLYAIAAAILGAGPAAEDVVQDCLVRIAERTAQVAAAADLGAYLAGMVRNRAIDRLRRMAPVALTAELTAVATIDPVLAAEASSRVAAAIAALPLEQREIVALHAWAGLSFRACGEQLGIPADTAASRWRYATAKLGIALQDLAP